MRHSTLRQIVTEPKHGRARSAADADARLALYEVTLTSLRLTLAESEQPHAWERVALSLADQRARLPVDALDCQPGGPGAAATGAAGGPA